MQGVSNNHAVVRLIISLLDGYLRYYPMQEFYSDNTTYLKGVNTRWSVSVLEQYRNKIKKLKKDLQRGRMTWNDLFPDAFVNQITCLRAIALRYVLIHSILDYVKADEYDRIVIKHSWYIILKMRRKTLLQEANYDIEYLKLPFEQYLA